MSIQLKLVSIKKENSHDSINKYVIVKKLDDIKNLENNIINSSNGIYKIKLRRVIKYIILEKIKELKHDEKIIKSIDENINKDVIKFICGAETIKDDDEIYNVEDKKVIYIFTSDEFSKEVLCKVFVEYGKDLSNNKKESKINEALEKELEEDHILEEKDMININEELINDFKDKDFVFLLGILNRRPDLFDKLYQYLSLGDIFDKDEFVKYTYEESEFSFCKELDSLLNLNLEVSENDLKKVLMYFKGHLNLSLRYIISQKKIE